jgi:hypothetical protein
MRRLAAVTVAALALLTLCAATPPGMSDRVHARRIVNRVRVARATYYRTPWVYVWGCRQVNFKLDCGAAGTTPTDSSLAVHLTDDTTLTVRDSLTASSSANAALDQVSNVALIGVRGNKALDQSSGKSYLLVPLSATTAGDGGGAIYIAPRWARLSIRFGSTDTSSYNGCDSLTVRSTTIRDWIFGQDY